MVPHYIYGRRKELQIGEFLERRGFDWGRSPGSRSPIDILAQKGRMKWAIQVKATRKPYTTSGRLSQEHEHELMNSASRIRAMPILALATRNYVWLVAVPAEDLLLKGRLMPLKYIYDDK